MASLDRKWWTLIAVCTATFMLLLDITVVNVALPDIQRSLNASFSDLQWVVDAYALTLAAFLLTAGVIGDMFGRREVFAVGLGVFSVSSLVCGLATSSLMLNLARAAQGVGGAVMFATSLALIAQAFSGRGARPSGSTARSSAVPSPWAAGRGRHHQGDRLAVDLLRQRPHRHRRRRHHPGQGPGVEGPEQPAGGLDRVRLVLRRPLHAGLRPRPRQRRRVGKHPHRRVARRCRVAPGRLPRRRVAPSRSDAGPDPVQAAGHDRRVTIGLLPLGVHLLALLVPDPLHPGRPRLRPARRRGALLAHHHAGLRRRPVRRQADRPGPFRVICSAPGCSSSPSDAC